jgi:hypothetical protein
MVKYTRRHFEDIAALIAAIPANKRNAEIEKYCNLFAADNPRFDRKKFAAACGNTLDKSAKKFFDRNVKPIGKFGDPTMPFHNYTDAKIKDWRMFGKHRFSLMGTYWHESDLNRAIKQLAGEFYIKKIKLASGAIALYARDHDRKTVGKFGNPSIWERSSTPETHTTSWRNKNTGAKISVVKDRNAGGYPGYAINKEGHGYSGFTVTGKKSTVKKDIKEFMKAWKE